VTFELARALLNAEIITPVPLARALYTVATEGVPLTRALLALGVVKEDRLEDELARIDVPTIHHVVPVPELLEQLPAGLCSRLLALPIRRDPRTGTVDVAVVDARDPHAANEIGFFLQAPVRVVRTTLQVLEAALDHTGAPMSNRAEALAPPMGSPANANQGPAKKARLEIQPSSYPPPRHPSVEIPIPLMKRNPLPVIEMEAEEDSPLTVEDDVVLELRPRRPPVGDHDARQFASPKRMPSVAPLAQQPTPANPFPDSSSVLAAIRSATSRDEILASLLLGIRSVARKAGLLVAKKDSLVGWMCNAELGDISALREVKISLASPSIFATSAAGRTYLGPIYRDRVSAPLLDVMGSTSRDIALTPVRVLGKTAVLVIADELGDTMLGTKAMEDLSKAAGEALARIVRRKHE
jgi:Type II secretion system (T2SS), protein E, N-terminal domain